MTTANARAVANASAWADTQRAAPGEVDSTETKVSASARATASPKASASTRAMANASPPPSTSAMAVANAATSALRAMATASPLALAISETVPGSETVKLPLMVAVAPCSVCFKALDTVVSKLRTCAQQHSQTTHASSCEQTYGEDLCAEQQAENGNGLRCHLNWSSS